MAETVSLEEARARLDAIDAEMHDLLMQRTEIVRDVAAAKANSGATGLSIRPGREAEVVRRLLNRHKGALPKAVIFRLWREIITAKAQIQTPFEVVLADGEETPDLRDTCRAHYGSNTAFRSVASEEAVLDAVRNAPQETVGVVRLEASSDKAPWWLMLANWRDEDSRNDEAVPTIVARLPFFAMSDGSCSHVDAFSIAAVPVEESEDDRTLIVVREGADKISARDDINVLASADGLADASLIDIRGCHMSAAAVQKELGLSASVRVLGTYAVPYVQD